MLQTDHEILVAPIHVHMHMVTMHAWMEDYNDGIHHTCMTNYDFIYVNFVQKSLMWDLSIMNFQIGKIFTEDKALLFGKIWM